MEGGDGTQKLVQLLQRFQEEVSKLGEENPDVATKAKGLSSQVG